MAARDAHSGRPHAVIRGRPARSDGRRGRRPRPVLGPARLVPVRRRRRSPGGAPAPRPRRRPGRRPPRPRRSRPRSAPAGDAAPDRRRHVRGAGQRGERHRRLHREPARARRRGHRARWPRRAGPPPRGAATPSGHRSPAATTPTGASVEPYPWRRSQRPTARALRRHAATTGRPVALAAALIAEPFGDGSTRSATTGALLQRGRGERPRVLRASSAGGRRRRRRRPGRAYSAACSPHGNGCTRMPRPTATSTAVVNERTSTTTRAAQTRPSSAAPVSPQSNRAPEPGCA